MKEVGNVDRSTKEQLEVINQQIKELVRIYRTAVSHSGISDNEFWIWYALVNMDAEFTQQDICGLWSLSKQTVNTIITHMVQKGYVTLDVIQGTRNRKRITLTEAGRSYGEKIVMPVSMGERRTLDRLPKEELEFCNMVLGKYISILKEELNGTEKQ